LSTNISFKASIEASAFPSCINPITAVARTTPIITHISIMMSSSPMNAHRKKHAKAATIKTMSNGLLNCIKNLTIGLFFLNLISL
jgi:hypothetical protein